MAEIVNISRNNEVRNKIAKGVKELVDSVKVTMGAGGRNVLIEKPFFTPVLTKDGVTVAKSIELEDKFENMGAQLIKDVASKTADEVGDGTTTATVLAGKIYESSLSYINSGYNPVKIKRALDMYTNQVLSNLSAMAKPVDNLESIKNVALISSNGDIEIANAIAEAHDIVGADGVITVENSDSFNTFVEFTEGMQFDSGYVSPYFVNNPKKLVSEFDNPNVLFINGIVNTLDDIKDILIYVLDKNEPLVIFANDFAQDVINKVVQNRLQRNLKICLVRLPYYAEERKEFVEDLSILCKCSHIDTDLGDVISECCLERTSKCVDKITISKNMTVIIKNDIDKEAINERIEQIKTKLNESKSPVEQNTLRDRLSKLGGSVAIIRVGGASEVEVQEKKDRIDDALHATKASIKEGVVIGGGYALWKCSYLLCKSEICREEIAAYEIMVDALREPATQILDNAGISKEYLYNETIKMWNEYGYDASQPQFATPLDLFSVGIIDPVLVEKTALKNAVSVVGLLITTECGIALQKREDELM